MRTDTLFGWTNIYHHAETLTAFHHQSCLMWLSWSNRYVWSSHQLLNLVFSYGHLDERANIQYILLTLPICVDHDLPHQWPLGLCKSKRKINYVYKGAVARFLECECSCYKILAKDARAILMLNWHGQCFKSYSRNLINRNEAIWWNIISFLI